MPKLVTKVNKNSTVLLKTSLRIAETKMEEKAVGAGSSKMLIIYRVSRDGQYFMT